MDQMARTPKQIGAIIQRQRRKLRQTQNGLGARIKHRQATISKLEAGEPGTRLGTLLDVLVALNLEMVLRPRTKGSPEDIEALF
ncbi:MAG TPA: transcriptional regulator [Candidatus Angelobacter sp.]|jgi:HTH-type transcriptional regulator/antitoxin HipB|nr:transcriptional regulator [Candidatus Angelobacter sp.]